MLDINRPLIKMLHGVIDLLVDCPQEELMTHTISAMNAHPCDPLQAWNH